MRSAAIVVMISICILVGCESRPPETPAQRYSLTGKIESIDRSNQTIVVNGDAIPGFMPAMSMPYKVKSASEFGHLAQGDSLAAQIVKQGDDYWLENVNIVPGSGTTKNPK